MLKQFKSLYKSDHESKWRNLLKEIYRELELVKRERNILKKENARLQAICDCQVELLGGRND
ncbi:TPA: hypothetical protein ACGOT0_002023 [Streptococcus suis]